MYYNARHGPDCALRGAGGRYGFVLRMKNKGSGRRLSRLIVDMYQKRTSLVQITSDHIKGGPQQPLLPGVQAAPCTHWARERGLYLPYVTAHPRDCPVYEARAPEGGPVATWALLYNADDGHILAPHGRHRRGRVLSLLLPHCCHAS